MRVRPGGSNQHSGAWQLPSSRPCIARISHRARSRSGAARPLGLPPGQHRHRLRAPLRLRPARAACAGQCADAWQRGLRHGRGDAPARHRRAARHRHPDGELRQRGRPTSRSTRPSRSTAASWCTTSTASGRREWLDGREDSPELRRARAMRPVVAAADHILDLHSTSQPVQPFWVYPAFERNAAAALAIGRPDVHLVMPKGLGSGTPVIQHGRHGEAGGDGRRAGGRMRPALPARHRRPGGRGDAGFPGALRPGPRAIPRRPRRVRSGASSCWRPASSRPRRSASCGRWSVSRNSRRAS